MAIYFTLIGICIHGAEAQQYASTKIKEKNKAYTDSLKQVKYDYKLPIWGQKAYSKGFDIPYPVGLMANFMYMKQGILIDNMKLGLKTQSQDIPLTNVEFIEFGDNINTAFTTNFRPDVWLFPFLNVYGIFGYGQSTTEVNLVSPVNLKSEVKQNISTTGVGIMSAFGVGPVWTSVDVNWTWNKPELLDKAVQVNVLGLRIGHTFTFKERPDRNIAIWAGGMRASMSSGTSGSINLSDALPSETWDRKDEIVAQYYQWYNNLNPNNPIDKKKIEAADQVLTPIIERLDALDGSATVSYNMDKEVKELWNGLAGVQFQFNKKWMLRSEAGFIGDRTSFLFSVNYRFLM